MLSFGFISSTDYEDLLSEISARWDCDLMSLSSYESIRPIKCDQATCVTANGMISAVGAMLYKKHERHVGQTL